MAMMTKGFHSCESNNVYEVEQDPSDDYPEDEIVWCVGFAPWPFKDRDFLQRRSHVPLSESRVDPPTVCPSPERGYISLN